MPATTNLLDAATLELVTKVGLPGGNVHVGFEGASASFALWVWDSALNDYRRLASSEDCGALDVSLATWRKLVGGATDAATSRTPVRVTAAEPGAADLVFRYWNVINGQFVEDEARQRLTAVEAPLRADVNRDGKIDTADAALIRAGRPFRFWFNEDAEKGDYAGQVADATPNASDLKVNGKLDLVNLFPVVVDVSQFRRAWGAATTARLRAGTSARLRYCVLGDGFSSENASGLATATVATADGTPLEEAMLTPLGYAGVDVGALSGGSLTSPFALAFEAAKSVDVWSGPEVVVSVGGVEVYCERLPVSITSVRNLYRFYSLRGAEDLAGGAFPLPPRPWAETLPGEKDVDVFFVHGFNVSEADARAWGDALFKRLWLSGSRARLHVVTWNGNYSWTGDWANGLHYHQDVYHALKTGDALRRLVEREQPDPTKRVLMAHSLGGLVACEAMKCGLRVGKCFLFNAAVASESLDATLQDADEGVRERYVPSDWQAYDPLSWAANWNRWFADSPGDARARLGWVGRYADALGNADEAYNYYSSGDEVFAEAANPPWLLAGVTESTASYAWQKQETLKGSRFLAGTAHGGWGFHTWRVAGFDYRYTAAEAAAMVADGSVTNSPVFNRGYAPMLDAAATDDEVAYALAKYVPTVSSATGGRAMSSQEIADVDMNRNSNGSGVL